MTELEREMLRLIADRRITDDANLALPQRDAVRSLYMLGLIGAAPLEGSDAAIDALWITDEGKRYLTKERRDEMTEPAKEKLTLPIVHDACPVCQSIKRLGATYIQELKDAGILHKDSFTEGFLFQIPLLDPARPPAILAPQMTIRVMMIYWDVCECGAIYCTKFSVVNAPAQVQMQQGHGPKFPEGMSPFGPRR